MQPACQNVAESVGPCHIDNTIVNERGVWIERVGAPMTTIQAVLLGIMLALTPSLVVLAFLLWRDEIGLPQANSDLEDQPPYPRT